MLHISYITVYSVLYVMLHTVMVDLADKPYPHTEESEVHMEY